MQKPHSIACERNSEPIYFVLNELFKSKSLNILEVGSGTGQHAAYLSKRFPNITWNCSDLKENHNGINLWIKDLNNVKDLVSFEVGKDSFPEGSFDAVFTANTFHIMSWEKVKLLIKLCGENLKKDSLLIIYGPFNYDGKYTSKSNADFDIWLKNRGANSSIRNFEDVNSQMKINNFSLLQDYKMPANNRILVFKKSS